MTNPTEAAAWRRALKRQTKILAEQKRTKQRAPRRATYGPGSRVYETQLMHQAQGGKCANRGCNAVIAPIGRGRAMDHDENGKPLAILCKSCSMALANVRRRRDILIGLLDYLNTHSQK